MAHVLPTIQNYSDYRDYLKAWFGLKKQENRHFSHRFLSRKLSLKSPNHIHLVMNKKRHLSLKTLKSLLKLLPLSSREHEYFVLLFKRQTSKSDVAGLDKKISELRETLDSPDISKDHFSLLANSVAWFLMVGAKKFDGQSLDQIYRLASDTCPFEMTMSELHGALELLIELNKVHRDQDCYFFDLEKIRTAWDFDSDQIKQFHGNNLALAARAIPWEIDRRFYSNVSIPTNDRVRAYAKSEIRSLCKRILEMSDREIMSKDDIDQVVSIQFAMFPFFEFSDADESCKKNS